MNGTLVVIVQPDILLLLFQFLHKLCNQIISLLASVATTYFASDVESATTFCSLKIQLIVVPPTVKNILCGAPHAIFITCHI
jgi:hypothetical protein